jgi:hypothetical protein
MNAEWGPRNLSHAMTQRTQRRAGPWVPRLASPPRHQGTTENTGCNSRSAGSEADISGMKELWCLGALVVKILGVRNTWRSWCDAIRPHSSDPLTSADYGGAFFLDSAMSSAYSNSAFFSPRVYIFEDQFSPSAATGRPLCGQESSPEGSRARCDRAQGLVLLGDLGDLGVRPGPRIFPHAKAQRTPRRTGPRIQSLALLCDLGDLGVRNPGLFF